MSRVVVGFDTATEAVAAAVGRWPDAEDPGAPAVLAARDVVLPRASLSLVLPAVRDLLEEAALSPADIDLVVVGRGPGSYTGVRIGMAAAKGLAQGLGVPVCGVGTLDAVAWGLRETPGLVGIVADAMRGEVYPALFEIDAGSVRRLTKDRVSTPEEAAEEWAATVPGGITLAGDGLNKHVATFTSKLGSRASIAPKELWLPCGSSVLAAAWVAAGAGAISTACEALPIYTRLADAEHAETRREPHVPAGGVGGPATGGDRG